MTQTALDRQVEGYQGSTPFGVRVTFSSRCQRNKNGKKSGADGALVTHEDAVPALSAEGTRIPDTPTAELTGYMFSQGIQPLYGVETNGGEGEENLADSVVSEEAGQKRSWA